MPITSTIELHVELRTIGNGDRVRFIAQHQIFVGSPAGLEQIARDTGYSLAGVIAANEQRRFKLGHIQLRIGETGQVLDVDPQRGAREIVLDERKPKIAHWRNIVTVSADQLDYVEVI
jgi:hypothetical protein